MFKETITSNKSDCNSEHKIDFEGNVIFLIIALVLVGLWLLIIGLLIKLYLEMQKVKASLNTINKLMAANPDKNSIKKETKVSSKEVIDETNKNKIINSGVGFFKADESAIEPKSLSALNELGTNSLISSNVYADMMTMADNHSKVKIKDFQLAAKSEDIVLAMNGSQTSSLDSTSFHQSQPISSNKFLTTN